MITLPCRDRRGPENAGPHPPSDNAGTTSRMLFSGVTISVSPTQFIHPRISFSAITNPNRIYWCTQTLQQVLPGQSAAQEPSPWLDGRISYRNSPVPTRTHTMFRHHLTSYANNEPRSEFVPASTCPFRKCPEILARLRVGGGDDLRTL